MYVFLNTKFTGSPLPTSLISLGMVDDSGRALYIEFNTFDRQSVDGCLTKNAIDNLFILKEEDLLDSSVEYGCGFLEYKNDGSICWKQHNVASDDNYIVNPKDTIEDWLCDGDTEVQIISDGASYDWVLFCQLFDGAFDLPEYISPYCHDLNQDIAKALNIDDAEAFNINREDFAFADSDCLTAGIARFEKMTGAKNGKHNALWDALVIKECWQKLNRTRAIANTTAKLI